MFLNLEGVDKLSHAELSVQKSHILHCEQLGDPALTDAMPVSLAREAPISRHKHTYLEGSLTPCSFSKATVVSSLGSWGFDQVYGTRHKFPAVEQASNPNRNWLVTLITLLCSNFLLG